MLFLNKISIDLADFFFLIRHKHTGRCCILHNWLAVNTKRRMLEDLWPMPHANFFEKRSDLASTTDPGIKFGLRIADWVGSPTANG